MLYWIYDVPPLWIVASFAVLFVGVCWLGIVLVRPFVRARLSPDAGLNEILGDFLQYFGVMYGLLLGLLAVATYQNHTDVEKAVSSEASSSAALYRGVSAYPEPQRTELKTLLREYARYVIEEAWPLQRQGRVPPGAVKRVADFQESLVSFEPKTKAQEALHDAAMRQFNSFFEYRRTGSTAGTPVSPRFFGIRSGSGHGSIGFSFGCSTFAFGCTCYLAGGFRSSLRQGSPGLLGWTIRFGAKWAYHPTPSNSSTINGGRSEGLQP